MIFHMIQLQDIDITIASSM